MYSCNGHLLLWDRTYKVVRKDPKTRSVWVNPVVCLIDHVMSDGTKVKLPSVTMNPASERLGMIQIDEDAVWLLPSDPKPSDGVRVIKRGEEDDESPKRKRGGPDTLYEFAFDDDELTLDDMPGQAQILADIFLDLFHADGTKSWTEKEIDDILHSPENIERLHTNQDPMNIFKFYRAPFARKGFIKRRG